MMEWHCVQRVCELTRRCLVCALTLPAYSIIILTTELQATQISVSVAVEVDMEKAAQAATDAAAKGD